MNWMFHAYFWPAFWIVFWGVRSAWRHRQRMEMARLTATQSSPSIPAADAKEVADLRERVKVLERITVDDRQSRELASEIESLRDK